MDSDTKIFVALGKFRAAEGHEKYPEGEKHGVLVFVRAKSHDEAEAAIVHNLREAGWVFPEIHKIGVIDETSPKYAESLGATAESGFSATIYSQPEEE